MTASQKLPVVRLPEPYKTIYELQVLSIQQGIRHFRLRRATRPDDGTPPPESLDHASLRFTDLTEPDASRIPAEGNNSSWARAQRSPVAQFTWDGKDTPSVGQIWNVIYAILTLHTEFEIFRVLLSGEGKELLAKGLQAVGLAAEHPGPSAPPGQPVPDSTDHIGQLVFFRSTFWQGAGSRFGPRPVWISQSPAAYPVFPVQQTLTTKFPDVRVHTVHPIRPAKPAPGSRIYSRYIPHLDEFFSIWALDYTNDEHLRLFNQWQNDPRVAQGWNETGTLDQHREYLRKIHEDPHQMAVLAKFNDTFFSYHEIYWAKVSSMPQISF